MTVRDLANELLDLQLWQAIILLLVCVFVGAFARAAGRDMAVRVFRKKR